MSLVISCCDALFELLAFCLLQSQKWTDDKDISSCQGCQKEFSVARRKVGGAGLGRWVWVCVCLSVCGCECECGCVSVCLCLGVYCW